MKTEKKMAFVEIEYWSCLNQKHRHRQQATAQACIDRAERPKKQPKRWEKEDLLRFLDAKESGQNISQLAREEGMSRSHMHRLIRKAELIRRVENATGKAYVMPHHRGSDSYL